jgi:hypothetical protein
MSVHPSAVKSAAADVIEYLDVTREMPDRADTSSKVPSPRLRNRRFVSVGSPFGPQFTGTPFHRQLGPFPGSGTAARSKRR